MTLAITPTEIEAIAQRAEQPVARFLSPQFHKAANAETDAARKETLELLGTMMLLGHYFRPGDQANPFGGRGGEWSAERFTREQAALAGELAPLLVTAELQAILADVSWLRLRRNPDLARLAVRSYIESAKATEVHDHWPDTVNRTERALRLGRSLGSDDPAFEDAKAYAESVVHKYAGKDDKFLTGKIVELLLEFGIGDPDAYRGYLTLAAETASKAKRYFIARFYHEVLVKLARRKGDSAGVDDAMRAVASTFEEEGRDRESGGNALAASHFFEKAIQAFRRVADVDADIERLRLDLQRVERASIAQMKPISSGPVDITSEVLKSRQHIAGHDQRNAFVRLVHVVHLANAETMKKQAQELARVSIVRRLVDRSHVDAEGRTIGLDPSSRDDEVTFGQLVEQYAFQRGFTVQAYILPALDQFNLEHAPDLHDLVGFASHSSFVPEGREEIFARGICAGLDMDFLAAVHLLVPQIENSIRYLMAQRGMIVTKLDQYGIQRFYELGELLIDDRVKTILSEDVLVELRTLLVDNRGPNLRHRIAHGMLDHSAFQTAECVYGWWLVLNLCAFAPSVRALRPAIEDADSTGAETGAQP